ncbi:MAG: glycosyltransferase family 2 protein [Candidatus Levybacteria bacterium]|nr:glycosyltransferase family 2 protein [Candidatus Levybacteria bacterium]
MIELSIIIVSFNTKGFIKQCIDAIYNSDLSRRNYEIILVDNASSDGTVEEVKKHFPQVFIIKNSDNFGFSKANNIGIRKSQGKFLLFLNPDTQVDENTLPYMISFMNKHSDVGVSTCFVRLPTGKLDDGAHRGFPTPWNSFCYFSGFSRVFPKSKIFSGYTMGWLDLSTEHEVDSVVGAFMMVRRRAGDEINWWDEDYFFYGEDIDFCFRLKEKGWKVYFVPKVFVLHHKGISGGIKKHSERKSTANLQTKMIATNARFNAMRIFYKKHYEKKYPKILNSFILSVIEFKRKISLSSIQK